MCEAITENITVTVKTKYIADQSRPDEDYFVWSYHIIITNLGQETVQLISRHWKITDGLGRLREVKGDGVVGRQPVLKPGANYSYTSGTPLNTPSGFMQGNYQMQRSNGECIDIAIPGFLLDSPFSQTILH